MNLPLNIHWYLDVGAATLVIVMTGYGLLRVFRLLSETGGNLLMRYIFFQTAALFVFASGRAVGHILKRVFLYTGHEEMWALLSPYSGGINTLTFVAFSIIALLYSDIERAETEIGRLSEEKRTIKSLLDYKQTILDSMVFPAMVISTDYRVIDVNKPFLELFGKDREEIIGRFCYEISHDSPEMCDSEDHPCPMKYILAGKYPVTMIHHHRGSEGERVVEIAASAVTGGNGEVTAMIEVLRDITEELRRDEERELMRSRLQELQKTESLRTLVGGIAHEFNNMLVGIQGNAEILLIKAGELKEEEKRRLRKIMDSSQKMADLIRKMMVYEQATSFEKSPLEMNDVIKDGMGLATKGFPPEIEVLTALSDEPLPIVGDRSSLFQVVINLLTNARDAMPNGGMVRVQSERKRVDGKDYAVLIVSDTGEGIEKELLSRIFDPFFTTKDVGKGTGMGLSVTKGIVEAHGGFIDVSSLKGEGATFSVYIPIHSAPAEGVTEERKSPSLKRGRKVLIAEDDRTVREILSEMVSEAGFIPVVAGDGREAVKRFEEEGDEIAAVFTDIIMPEMTGYELLKVIRKTDEDIPVIAISGHAGSLRREDLLKEGFQDFIEKPFTMERLKEALDLDFT